MIRRHRKSESRTARRLSDFLFGKDGRIHDEAGRAYLPYDEDEDDGVSPIPFLRILAAVRVEVDEYAKAPWEDCDGWEHVIRDPGYDDDGNPDHVVWCCNKKGYIHVATKTVEGWQGEWSPFSGETRQHYAEKIARCRKKAIEQIVEWYEHGWTAWDAVCEFGGHTEYHGNVYADYDEVEEHCEESILEAAEEVAALLVKDGRKVTGRPRRPSARQQRAWRIRNAVTRRAWRNGFESAEEYKKWLAVRPRLP